MDIFRSPSPPHPDVRVAIADDILRLKNYEHEPPVAIADVVEQGEGWLASTARSLVEAAGSVEALEQLDATPHPFEPFTTTGLDPDDRLLAGELLGLIDAAGVLHDDETATITHRMLRELLDHPDRPLRRKARIERVAAALAWTVYSANAMLGRGNGRVTAAELAQAFGETSVSDIGRGFATTLARTNRSYERPIGDSHFGRYRPKVAVVGHPALLHSRYRAELVEQRNDLKRRLRADQIAATSHHAIQFNLDGSVSFRAEPTTVRWAVRSPDQTGRSVVMVALRDLESMHLLSISVPDARRLIEALDHALNEPMIDAA